MGRLIRINSKRRAQGHAQRLRSARPWILDFRAAPALHDCLETIMADGRVCPDCPAALNGIPSGLVQQRDGSCALRCVGLRAREPLPSKWSSDYGLMLVRRGIVVRQRVDANGCATAVDAVGPRGAAPMSETEHAAHAGYAAADCLLCLCPTTSLRAAVDAGASGAAQVVALHTAALDRVERLAEARCRATALARVAAAIDVLADTLSPPRRLEVVPSALQQRDMAALLALRHESVCRALGTLERHGAIVRSEEGIRIRDRRVLNEVD